MSETPQILRHEAVRGSICSASDRRREFVLSFGIEVAAVVPLMQLA